MELEKKIKHLLDSEIKNGTFPGAVVLVEQDERIICRTAVGYRQIDPAGEASEEMTLDTLFDLASLTKPLATALLTMIVFEKEKESLKSEISRFLKNLPKISRKITVFQLLTHSSGLPPVPDIYQHFPDPEKIDPVKAKEILLTRVPVKKPGTEIIYSCTGYLFAGLLLERITGMRLGTLFRKLIVEQTGIPDLFFNPGKKYLKRTAATEYCSWRKRRLKGEVHDENSYCMGGDGGNAGLFGTADSVLKLTEIFTNNGRYNGRIILKPESVKLMTRVQVELDRVIAAEQTAAGKNAEIVEERKRERRSVGFMFQGSTAPCGPLFGKNSYGHTGFTGTSIWIDPEKKIKIIVFTNRVYFGRETTAEKIKAFRKKIHSLIWSELF